MTDLFEECCPHCKRPYTQEAPDFAVFWQKCPRKIGKDAAARAWKKLTPQERTLAQKHVQPFYAWFAKEYPTASLLHPSTYLNGKRWEDETGPAQRDESDVLKFWADQINGTQPLFKEPKRELLEKLVASKLVTVQRLKERKLA